MDKKISPIGGLWERNIFRNRNSVDINLGGIYFFLKLIHCLEW